MIALTGALGVMVYRHFRCQVPEWDYTQPKPIRNVQTETEGTFIDTPTNTAGSRETATVAKVNSATIEQLQSRVYQKYANEAARNWGVNTFAKMVCK